MKKSIETGQTCYQTTMRERLERFGETRIIYETDGFGLDFVKKIQRRSGSTIPKMGAVLQRRTNLEFVYSQQLRRRENAMGSRKEATFLRCMLSSGVNVGFPRKIR